MARWSQDHIDLVVKLKRGECKLSEISEATGIPPSTVAYILRKQAEAGVNINPPNNTVSLLDNTTAVSKDLKPVDPVTLQPDMRPQLCIVLSRAQLGLEIKSVTGESLHNNALALRRAAEHIHRSILWTNHERLRGITLIIASGWIGDKASPATAGMATEVLAKLVNLISVKRSGLPIQMIYAGSAQVGKKRIPIQQALDMKLEPTGSMSTIDSKVAITAGQHIRASGGLYEIRGLAHAFPRFMLKCGPHDSKTVMIADGQALTRMKAVTDMQRWIKNQIADLHPNASFILPGLRPEVHFTQNVILPGSLSGEFGDSRYGAPIQQVAFLERQDGQRDVLINELTHVTHPLGDIQLALPHIHQHHETVTVYARRG